MKKNEFDFLNFFVTMLQQGYDIDNILKLCQFLHYKKESQLITKYLNEGYTLQEALLNCHFSRIFQKENIDFDGSNLYNMRRRDI